MAKPYGYCIFDLETSTGISYKRRANPFNPDNIICAIGWKFKGEAVQGKYIGKLGKKPFDWFTSMLDGTNLLVGANIKFDLLYALREPQNYEAWKKWVVNGGQVWDCQLAEYLLRGMEQSAHMLSLDEMAVVHGGSLKIDEVKALWEAGVDTPDIDPDLLMDYLIGRNGEGGDIQNTEIVFTSQLAKARASGQVKSILLNCGALLCTVEMERNGMYVDKEAGLKLADQLAIDLVSYTAKLVEYLPKDLPFDFNWNSPIQKSALIFGGTVKYEDREYLLEDGKTVLIRNYDSTKHKLTYPLVDELHYILNTGETTSTAPTMETCFDYATYKGGAKSGEYKTKKVKVPDLTRPKARYCDATYTFKGYTQGKKAWEGATPGVYSTGADIIEELAVRNIPFLKDLAKVTSLTKDLGTYYITTDKDGKQKGMLTLVQAEGIIHHMLNMCSTVTARLSSSNPNLQNLPKGNKSDVKTLFISRWLKAGRICQSDFSALEIYIQAILTLCKQLIDDLLAGLDLHCVRVSQKESISYEEAFYLCKTQALSEWDKKRTDAKVFSFQRAYGAGAQKISDSTGIAFDDVIALIEAEVARYPEIEPFFVEVGKAIQASRVPTLTFVAHPDAPAITCQLGKGYYRTPDNKVYSYRESPSPKFMIKQGVYQSFSPTEIKNYIVQGTGGEWAKAAMWLALRLFYKHDNFGSLALLVNQVHDAIYGDYHESVALEASAALHAAMEEASTFMEWYFGWSIPVPVPSDTTLGMSMKDESKITDPAFPELVKKYKRELRDSFMGSYKPSFDKD